MDGRRLLEQVKQEDRDATDEFALIGLTDALGFLSDRGEVSFRDAASAQQRRLLDALGV